jgi:hypothetical protein
VSGGQWQKEPKNLREKKRRQKKKNGNRTDELDEEDEGFVDREESERGEGKGGNKDRMELMMKRIKTLLIEKRVRDGERNGNNKG